MDQKTISLNEKAYKKLKRMKNSDETYSDTILRLCELQEKVIEEDILLKFAGTFKENTALWENVEKEIQHHRDNHLISEEDG